MVNRRYILVLLLVCILLSSCGGWRLRGTKIYDSIDVVLYLKQENAKNVAQALREELRLHGVELVDRGKADFVLFVTRERYDRRLLSVSTQTGKAREIELILLVDFDVRTSDGELVLTTETYSMQKDFIFDETSIYGTNENEKVLRRSLSEEAASNLTPRVLSALRAYQAR